MRQEEKMGIGGEIKLYAGKLALPGIQDGRPNIATSRTKSDLFL